MVQMLCIDVLWTEKKMSDYVKEAKKLLDLEVEREIEYLTELAAENYLEADWVIQTFADKFIYKVKEMGVK